VWVSNQTATAPLQKSSDSRPGPALVGCIFSHTVCYDCLGGANARFPPTALRSPTIFFGQPEVERHERREARFIVLVVVFCSLLYTALPLWWKGLKSVLFYYLFPRVLLYIYQPLHPLVFSSLQQQQDRGEKLSAVKKCLACLLACLPLLPVVRFPLFELCCPPSPPPPPPLAIFPGTTFAHPHGRELLEVGRADRPLLFCLCPKCLSCAIGIAVCVTLSI